MINNRGDKKSDISSKLNRLRDKSERVFRENPADALDISRLSKVDLERLVHELHVHQIEVETQGEELIRVQEELEKQRLRYLYLFDYAPVGYFTVSRKGNIEEVNLTGAAMTGINRKDLIGKPFFRVISTGSRDSYYKSFNEIYQTGISKAFEVKMIGKENREFYAQLECNLAAHHGNVEDDDDNQKKDNDTTQRNMQVVAVDVDERKHHQELINASLEEKEILLKEIHHRVKNNLAVVSGILRVQASMSDNETCSRIFSNCRDRIQSMALVHEKLYFSENLSQIDFASYIKDLFKYLLQAFNVDKQKLTVNLSVNHLQLDIIKAVPCGLIINELVTNALKYGVNENGEGEINLSLVNLDEDRLQITISDKGSGFPPGLDAEKFSTMGFTMVKMLTKQIEGSIRFENEKGAKITLIFPRR